MAQRFEKQSSALPSSSSRPSYDSTYNNNNHQQQQQTTIRPTHSHRQSMPVIPSQHAMNSMQRYGRPSLDNSNVPSHDPRHSVSNSRSYEDRPERRRMPSVHPAICACEECSARAYGSTPISYTSDYDGGRRIDSGAITGMKGGREDQRPDGKDRVVSSPAGHGQGGDQRNDRGGRRVSVPVGVGM